MLISQECLKLPQVNNVKACTSNFPTMLLGGYLIVSQGGLHSNPPGINGLAAPQWKEVVDDPQEGSWWECTFGDCGVDWEHGKKARGREECADGTGGNGGTCSCSSTWLLQQCREQLLWMAQGSTQSEHSATCTPSLDIPAFPLSNHTRAVRFLKHL